jgi:RNA polymerase sigma-70 factor (ECF subfamily)
MRKPLPSESRLSVVRAPEASAEDDASLARAAAEGDTEAAERIFGRYSRVIRGLLRRSLGQNDVDDHVQEVFLRLFAELERLRDPAALRSFLIGIAIRVAGTELRRRRVRRWLSLTASGDPPELAVPPLDASAREALQRLYAILDRQDPDSRLLFTMRYVERLELTELAQAFDVSLATLKRRLARVSDRVFAGVRRDELLLPYLESGSPALAIEKSRERGGADGAS